MSVETAADRLSMLTDFGVEALYTPQGGEPAEVIGIFDHDYIEVLEVESRRPVFHVREEDVPDARRGDSLVVGAHAYTVISTQPDGTGMTLLVLEADHGT